jgi:hypothetical protein
MPIPCKNRNNRETWDCGARQAVRSQVETAFGSASGQHHRGGRLSRETSVASELALLFEAWPSIQVVRPNLLFIGSDADVNRVLNTLGGSLHAPITCSHAGALGLPPQRGGTFVIRDAIAMSTADQQRLLEWLGTRDPLTQVITTSDCAVFPWVQRGIFLESLYYLLNVMTIVLDGSAERKS